MTVAVMQPYLFPYIGYFQLISLAERFILFDTVQYRRRSWMSHNRIMHPVLGWQYVTVPVHAHRGTLIKDVMLVDVEKARDRILGQLDHYRGKAPHFLAVRDLVSKAFSAASGGRLADLSLHALIVVCEYLGLPFSWARHSEMPLSPLVSHPGQWALEISDALGADRYVNLPGGRDIFRPHEWQERKIELRFLNPTPYRYATDPYLYQENLSILDVLMWNTPDSVMTWIVSMTGTSS